MKTKITLKNSLLYLAIVLLTSFTNSSNAQFGDGSAGYEYFGHSYPYSFYNPTTTSVVSISGNVVTFSSGGSFSVGDEIVMIQMTGAVDYTNNGRWTRAKITAMTGNNATILPVLPSTNIGSYDLSAKIQIIKMVPYDVFNISDPLTPPAFNYSTGRGGVVCLLAKTAIYFQSSTARIDVKGKGFKGAGSNVLYGNWGANPAGLGYGSHGTQGTNGGANGVGGLGVFGGGDGGNYFVSGINGSTPSVNSNNPSGNTAINAKNASGGKRFVLGDGGSQGYSNTSGRSGGGGGGGSDQGINLGTNGMPGGKGGNSGGGGWGGRGGGIVMIFTPVIHDFPWSNSYEIDISASPGASGRNGTAGAKGGDGGTGGGRACNGAGGGGGGGNGAGGGDGGDGGGAGAGGYFYVYRNPGGVPLASLIKNSAASGGNGGIGGVGGAPGENGGDANITAVMVCPGLPACSTGNILTTALNNVFVYDANHTLVSASVNSATYSRIQNTPSQMDVTTFTNVGTFFDCNNAPYNKVTVTNTIGGISASFDIFSNNGTYADLLAYLYSRNQNSVASQPTGPVPGGLPTNDLFNTGTAVWVSECYAEVSCLPYTGGVYGPDGIDGSKGPDATGGHFSEDFVGGGGSNPTPVTLLTFNVKSNNLDQSHLNWSTAQEQNNQGFEIEHSINGNDFRKVGFVNGSGNTSEKKDYSFIHQSPVNGINYYRLKQIDIDGKFEYSQIESLDFESEFELSVYPNPIQDELNIMAPNNTAYKILDMTGSTIKWGTYNGNPIDVSVLAKGFYILRASRKGKIQHVKFTK